jgi:hypothetical protein
LLFLPPCGPHLIPFGHRVHRAKHICLSTPRRPSKAKTFRTYRNLHLQYSVKSQSTPRCHSLVTPGSDHQAVLGCSDPHLGRTLRWTTLKNV